MTAPLLARRVNGSAPPAKPPLLLLPRGPLTPWAPVPDASLDSSADSAADTARPPAGTVADTVPDNPADNPADIPAPAPAPPADTTARASRLAMPRWHAPDGDTVITWAMAITVALVAIDAAIVSYTHIYGLAAGQPGTGVETGIQPKLLPLSIDGEIAEAGLVKLFAARHRVKAPALSTFMLWLGIVMTVGANVVHGLPTTMLPPLVHTCISAVLSAWPAGAFIGSVEMAMQLVRARGQIGNRDADRTPDNEADTGADSADGNTATARGADTDTHADNSPDRQADADADNSADMSPDSQADTRADKPADSKPDTPPGRRGTTPDRKRDTAPRAAAPRRGQRPAPKADKVADTISRHPDWDPKRIADACGVHPKTVKRRLERGTGTAGTTPPSGG